ncbi:hypothetical protein AAE478_005474 [Parahypoxylon ruwenzoriense]
MAMLQQRIFILYLVDWTSADVGYGRMLVIPTAEISRKCAMFHLSLIRICMWSSPSWQLTTPNSSHGRENIPEADEESTWQSRILVEKPQRLPRYLPSLTTPAFAPSEWCRLDVLSRQLAADPGLVKNEEEYPPGDNDRKDEEEHQSNAPTDVVEEGREDRVQEHDDVPDDIQGNHEESEVDGSSEQHHGEGEGKGC